MPAPDAALDDKCALLIGPVEGLTQGWHHAPSRTAIPVGHSVLLLLTKSVPGDVKWTGALEVFEDAWGSVARCPLGVPGDLAVRAALHDEGGLVAERSCDLSVTGVAPAEISVLDVVWSTLDLGLSDPPTNEETMRAYFGESVAALTPLGEGLFATSIHRTIVGRAVLSHPEFLPLVEWRVGGAPGALGPAFRHARSSTGPVTIEAGRPGLPHTTKFIAYRTSVRMHAPDGYVFDGLPVTYSAVTDPPGFEKHVSWLASTKYGFSEPVTGSGPEFTTTFHNSFGLQDDASLFQWLGAKADNSANGQDAKVVCPRHFRYDGNDHALVRRVFTLASPVFRIDLDPAAPAPVIILAKDPGGVDIPDSEVELEPGGSIIYGVDDAETYVIRTTDLGDLPGIACAVQPPLALDTVRSFPDACGQDHRRVITSVRAVGSIRINAEPKNAAGADSCPVTIEIVIVRTGQPDVIVKSVPLTAKGVTGITYKNTDATATIQFRARCEEGPGDCFVTFSGGFFAAAAAPPPPEPEHELIPLATVLRACAGPTHTILLGNEPSIYRAVISGPTGAQASTCPPTISQTSGISGTSFPNRTVGPGETFILEIDNRTTGRDASITYSCPFSVPDQCNLTYRVLMNPAAATAFPPITVASQPCGAASRRLPFITNVPGTYALTLSVPATDPDGGAACPVTIRYRQWNYNTAAPPVGFGADVLPSVTLQPGETVTSVYAIAQPTPPDAFPQMIIIEITCSGANPGTCNYTFTASR